MSIQSRKDREILREGHEAMFDFVEAQAGKREGGTDEQILRGKRGGDHDLNFNEVKNRGKKEAHRISNMEPCMTEADAWATAQNMVMEYRKSLVAGGVHPIDAMRETRGLVEKYLKEMSSLIKEDTEPQTDNSRGHARTQQSRSLVADVPDADECTQEELNQWFKEQGWTD